MAAESIIHDLFFDYTLRTVVAGSAVLGFVSGALGTYAVLKKQSLLGDAISHASLPGIAIAFLLTASKAPLVLITGAAVAGWLGTLLVIGIIRTSRIKEDSALGIVLSVFFGIGLVLLTFIQRMPTASKAGLDRFLFGQAATIVEHDVVIIASLGFVVILFVIFLWKEFRLLSFDPDFTASIGYPVKTLEIILTTLIVLAIVIGLQTVGAVLMSAMLVAPAAAARQWTNRLGNMLVLSGIFGAISGISGSVISSATQNLPTGPTIILCVSAIVLVSILFAPNRGIVWAFIRKKINDRKIQMFAVLEDLFALYGQHENSVHPHSINVIRAMSSGHGGTERTLQILLERGLANYSDGWSITSKGIEEMRKFMSERRRDEPGTG